MIIKPDNLTKIMSIILHDPLCYEHSNYHSLNQATGMTKISRGGIFGQGGVYAPPGKTGSSAFSAIWALIKLN